MTFWRYNTATVDMKEYLAILRPSSRFPFSAPTVMITQPREISTSLSNSRIATIIYTRMFNMLCYLGVGLSPHG
jgi:hypothetical protein